MREQIQAVIALYHSAPNIEEFNNELFEQIEDPSEIITDEIYGLTGKDIIKLSKDGDISSEEAIEFASAMYDSAVMSMV